MSLLDMDQILMQTAQAVKQMNQPASPSEATREFYRQQGRKQEQERIIAALEASAIAWSDDCALPVDWKHCQNCWQIASLITRIKGERE